MLQATCNCLLEYPWVNKNKVRIMFIFCVPKYKKIIVINKILWYLKTKHRFNTYFSNNDIQ